LYATDFRERAPQADFAGVCSADILTIRERWGEVAPGFLQHLLYDRGFWDFIVANSTGSITRRIKWRQIAKYEFALPPIDEQQRIVELLSAVDAHVSCLAKQAEAALTARSAVLSESLSAGGDDWIETSLGALCDLYQPKTISKSQMSDAAPYVVYGANGPVGRFDRFNHEEPEVVVTCRGATCGVVNMSPEKCWITGNAMVVRPKDRRVNKEFLYLALQASVNVQATISGSAQPQITKAGLSPAKIQLPPEHEQMRIVEIVSSLHDVVRSTEQAVADSMSLRAGLLSVLLERGADVH
jgi:restriction endonuclease S subunit